MRPFERELARVAERLDVPQPERGRILDEMAADLDALRHELIGRGVPPDEAEAEAVALLAPSDIAMMALVSVHESTYRSLARRFSSRLRLAEWGALVGVSVASIAFVLASLAGSGVLRRPSLFLAPVLVLGVALVALAGRKAIALFLERDHDADRLRSGLGTLVVGAAAAVLVSFAGVALELSQLAAVMERDPTRAAASLVPWLLETSVLLGAGLTTALVAGLGWFLLRQKICSIEEADVRAARTVGRATSTLRVDRTLTSTGAHP